MSATSGGPATEDYNREGLGEEIEVCMLKLEELEKIAQNPRKKFLVRLKEKAESRGDEKKKTRQLREMIVREAQRKH